MGLSAHLEKYPEALSGGQQQRVAIARALAAKPALILADEPTGNLDSANSDKVFNLLLQFAREENIAVLLVTHNTDLALRCDRTLQMRDGLMESIS